MKPEESPEAIKNAEPVSVRNIANIRGRTRATMNQRLDARKIESRRGVSAIVKN